MRWNTSNARYVAFYDARLPVAKLAERALDWASVPALRLQLLLAMRFIMLCRNVDLERVYRTFSMVDGKPFILIQRKGW